MKRYPNLFHVKFLILSGEKVNDWNTKFELPLWDKEDITELKDTLKAPKDFRQNDRKHTPSTNYMREQQVFNLFYPDEATIEALSLINTLSIRSALEKLILSDDEPKKIAKSLNSKFLTHISGDAVERYRQYFWNPKIMKVSDWERIFADNRSLKRDAINIIRNGPDYARHILGFIQNVQIKESLKELVSTLHFDMQELKHHRASREKIQSLSTIANTLIKIDEKLSTNDVSMKEEFKNFERIQIEHTNADIKSMNELAPGGNYTNSGRDLLELPAVSTMEKVIDLSTTEYSYAEK